MVSNGPPPPTPSAFIGNDNSQPGVIVDRSGFEEDDELTFPREIPFAIDEEQSLSDTPVGNGGAKLMKNGKVRRKLRWKPMGFRRNKTKDNVSSNQSVVSALTNRSSSTARSTSTARSFLSHFSRKSQNSFHTFHSTATPLVKNSKQSQHTFQRPNYQDTFELGKDQATIANEGRHVHQKIAQSPNKEFQLIETVDFERSNTMPSRLDSMPLSPMSDASVQFFDPFGETNVPITSHPSTALEKGKVLPTAPIKPQKSRRPPLFKRTLKIAMGKVTTGSKKVDKAVPFSNDDSPSSPVLASDTVPTMVSSESPLSELISLERQDSALPMLEEEDYAGDRRVALCIGTNKRKDSDFPHIPVDPSGADETDSLPGSTFSGIQSLNQSLDTASVATTNISTSTPVSATKSLRSATASPSPGTQSTARRRYNRPVESTTILGNTEGTTDESRQRRSSVPVDLDEGAFLEAEHNLRAIHDMAAEHLEHGEFEEAIEVFEEILRGQGTRYGSTSYRVGTALHNLGLVQMKSGDYDKAIEICRKAVQVRKEALVPNHPDVAVSLAQLGVAYLENEDFEESLVIFREALHIRRNFLGPRHSKCAKVLNNMGCAFYSMEDYDEARDAYEEALEIQRDALRTLSDNGEDPSTVSSNTALLSVASTLCNLASIKLKRGQYEEAELALEETLLLQQSVLPDEHPTIQTTFESIDFVKKTKEGFILNASELLAKWSKPTRSFSGEYQNVLVCSAHPIFEDTIALDVFDSISPQSWFEQVGDAIAERAGCGTINISRTEFAPGELNLNPTETAEQQ